MEAFVEEGVDAKADVVEVVVNDEPHRVFQVRGHGWEEVSHWCCSH